MRFSTAIFTAAMLIFCNCIACYAIDDAIIAVVNDDVITLGDLKDYLTSIYMELVSLGKSEDEIQKRMEALKKQGVDKLIERKLLVDEANRKGLTINDLAIEERLQAIKAHYGSDSDFRKAIAKDGITITELIKTITDQLKSRSIVDLEIKSKIFVSPQEITEYYQKNKSKFLKPESVELKSIFIPYIEGKQAAKKTSLEVSRLLKEPSADFSQIAAEYSKAPSMSIVFRGETLPKIENILFQLKENEISKPVETEAGFYIFKVIEKHDEQIIPLEDARDQISNFLFMQKFQERTQAWLKELKDRAYIEIKG